MEIIQYKMSKNNYIEKDLKDYLTSTIIIPGFLFVYQLLSSYFNFYFGLDKTNLDSHVIALIILQFAVHSYILANYKNTSKNMTKIIKVNKKLYLISTILFPISWIIISLFIGFILYEDKRFEQFVKQLLLLFPIQLFINIIIAFFYTETKNNN